MSKKLTRWEEFTLKIWNSREHKCQCCDEPLGFPMRAHYFSHILGKGSWPMAKWWPENIFLMCWNCHQDWDFGTREQEKFKGAHVMRSTLLQAINFLSNYPLL